MVQQPRKKDTPLWKFNMQAMGHTMNPLTNSITIYLTSGLLFGGGIIAISRKMFLLGVGMLLLSGGLYYLALVRRQIEEANAPETTVGVVSK